MVSPAASYRVEGSDAFHLWPVNTRGPQATFASKENCFSSYLRSPRVLDSVEAAIVGSCRFSIKTYQDVASRSRVWRRRHETCSRWSSEGLPIDLVPASLKARLCRVSEPMSSLHRMESQHSLRSPWVEIKQPPQTSSFLLDVVHII